ncbi:MAG: hypothetical protein JWN86_349 [Planctomycetota bacterium]|nr:hypothetical protein [Planctomycetota bacterium]
MYGVPADLDLRFLHGATLMQVCLGTADIQFHFHPTGHVSVQGGWQQRDALGEIVDKDSEVAAAEREPFRLHRLLGRRVESIEVAAPSRVSFRFEGGDELQIFDDSVQFESFQIQPGDIIV